MAILFHFRIYTTKETAMDCDVYIGISGSELQKQLSAVHRRSPHQQQQKPGDICRSATLRSNSRLFFQWRDNSAAHAVYAGVYLFNTAVSI
ncbi:MAG: hypothetical protein IJB41_03230, partial [Clostridia bacterium]|nr:hypothetical protein [Clostridia bacterium]